MDRIKIHIDKVYLDNLYDCIYTNINGQEIQIVFAKQDNIAQYNEQDVYLSKNQGEDYRIETISEIIDDYTVSEPEELSEDYEVLNP